MSQASRKEVLARLRQRYPGRGKQGRGRLVRVVRLQPQARDQSAQRQLAAGRSAATTRRAKYGAAHLSAVKAVWLAGALPLWLPFYERQHGQLSAAVRHQAGQLD